MLVNNNKVVKEKTEIIIKMSQLFSFLQPQQYSYPSIFIYGHRASGKSHVMQVLLKELEVRKRHLLSGLNGLLGGSNPPTPLMQMDNKQQTVKQVCVSYKTLNH